MELRHRWCTAAILPARRPRHLQAMLLLWAGYLGKARGCYVLHMGGVCCLVWPREDVCGLSRPAA